MYTERTITFSSSHISKCPSTVLSICCGKYLVNLTISCNAKRFSLTFPLKPLRIDKYSASYYNKIVKKTW